jgi:collagenase-like PrtC family protease
MINNTKEKKMKKIFAMPLAGGLSYVKKIVEKYKNIIYEFYGDNGNYLSAIYSNKIDDNEFEDIVSYLHDNDIKFNYTMNSLWTPQYLQDDMYKIIIDFLCDIDADAITVTEPYFGMYAKEQKPSLKIIASSLMQVKSEAKISKLLKYKFDRIILSEDCLKTIPLLKYLRRVTPENVKLEILIYNWCKMGCVNRILHHSTNNNDILKKVGLFGADCTKTLKEFLMASWIRPKDIPRYQEIGIDLFKFNGRNFSEDFTFDVINKYLKDYLNDTDNIAFYNLSASDFDEFFDFLFEKGCNERCLDCNMCEYFAKKLF